MDQDPSKGPFNCRDEILAKTLLSLEDWKRAGVRWIIRSEEEPVEVSDRTESEIPVSNCPPSFQQEVPPVRDSSSTFSAGTCRWGIVFVRLCPSLEEQQKNIPYSDAAGILLHKIIEAMHLSPADVYCTYLFQEDPGVLMDDDPRIQEALLKLVEQLTKQNARVVVPFSERLSQWMSGREENYDRLRKIRLMFAEKFDLVPSLEPGLLIRRPELKRPVWKDMQGMLKQLQDSLAE